MASQKLQRRIAEETQLLAEEKWIIKTLNLIKKERNSLQIERLQLESLKMHAQGLTPRSNRSSMPEEPSTSLVNLMQNSKGFNSGDRIVFEDESTVTNKACNEEELNLAVSTSVFRKVNDDLNMEEDEDYTDDMDVLIDMNMLMNGQ